MHFMAPNAKILYKVELIKKKKNEVDEDRFVVQCVRNLEVISPL